jgi:hypothetical protein
MAGLVMMVVIMLMVVVVMVMVMVMMVMVMVVVVVMMMVLVLVLLLLLMMMVMMIGVGHWVSCSLALPWPSCCAGLCCGVVWCAAGGVRPGPSSTAAGQVVRPAAVEGVVVVVPLVVMEGRVVMAAGGKAARWRCDGRACSLSCLS